MKCTHRELKNVILQVAPALLISLAVAGNAYGVNTVVDLSTLMPNPSFEAGNQPTAPGDQVGCPVGWTCGGSPSPGGTSYAPTGAQYVAGSDGLPSPLIVPNGSAAGQCPTLLAGSCTLYALNLGTYQANTTYTLTLWVGTPLTVPNCGTAPGCVANVSLASPVSRVTAYFLGNGNAQFAANNIPVPAPGQWQKVPLSFTPAGYQIGHTINFLLFASTGQGYQQVNFDIDLPTSFYCSAPITPVLNMADETFQIIFSGPVQAGQLIDQSTGQVIIDFNTVPNLSTNPTYNITIGNNSGSTLYPVYIFKDLLGSTFFSPSCTTHIGT